jgi:hypothetical protein
MQIDRFACSSFDGHAKRLFLYGYYSHSRGMQSKLQHTSHQEILLTDESKAIVIPGKTMGIVCPWLAQQWKIQYPDEHWFCKQKS